MRLFSLITAAAGLVSIVVGVGILLGMAGAAIVGGGLAVTAAVILYEPETESQRRDRRAKAHKA